MTAPLRTLLIDDEQAARARLRRMLQDRPSVEIVGEARDGVEAVQLIEELRPGLIFLDVQMPGLDGFDVLRAVTQPPPLPMVIFVTGFDQHALRAFQVHALAYLLKPIEQEALDAVMERAWSIHGYQTLQNEQDAGVRSMLESAPARLDRVVARKANRMLLLDPADICFFLIETGIVRVSTRSENYWVNYTMSDLETALADRKFFRAHRSALINLDQVREIRPSERSSFQLIMNDERATAIDVSERQGRALRTLVPGL